MSDVDYKKLSEVDLKQYVKSHPQDEDAFQYWLTIMRAKPSVTVTTDEQLEDELKKRLERQRQSD